jgi:hypothetical protein
MSDDVVQSEHHIYKEKLERLREHLHVLVEQYGCVSKEILIASAELDECILLYLNFYNEKCNSSEEF